MSSTSPEDNITPIGAPPSQSHKPDRWPTFVLVGGIFACLICFGFGLVGGLPFVVARVVVPPLATSQAKASQEQFAPTGTAMAVAQATAGVQAQWPLLISDSFDSNENNWFTSEYDTDDLRGSQAIRDGKYRWELDLKRYGGTIFEGFSDMASVADFYVTTEVRLVSGPESADYGLQFRRQSSEDFYYFGIDNVGGLAFALLYRGQWLIERYWSLPASAFVAGQPNQLAVAAVGNRFTFFVNGQYAGEAIDNRLASGKIGYMAQIRQANAPVILQFDDFELRVPEEVSIAGPTATTAAERFDAGMQWPIVFEDSFEEGGYDWPVGRTDDEYAKVEWTIEDGRYLWTFTAHQGVNWRETPRMNAVGDFMLTADAQNLGGPRDATYGVAFRWESEEDFYYFGIDDAGEASVWLLKDNEWTSLAQWVGLSAIQAGEINQLGVIGQGSTFTFFVNGQYVGDLVNTELPKGVAGLVIELMDANDHGAFAFDNFVVRAPPGVEAAPSETPTPQTLLRSASLPESQGPGVNLLRLAASRETPQPSTPR